MSNRGGSNYINEYRSSKVNRTIKADEEQIHNDLGIHLAQGTKKGGQPGSFPLRPGPL